MSESVHAKDYEPAAAGPLAGVRIVDLSRLVAGNMVTHVLSDFGADVIKVEDPKRGDDLRHWRVEGVSTFRAGQAGAARAGPDELLKRTPHLVVVRVSGCGQTGPS